jgi:hypothetical protein
MFSAAPILFVVPVASIDLIPLEITCLVASTDLIPLEMTYLVVSAYTNGRPNLLSKTVPSYPLRMAWLGVCLLWKKYLIVSPNALRRLGLLS